MRENKEEAIPVLLEYIQYALDNIDRDISLSHDHDDDGYDDYDKSEDIIDPMYAIYLLAEFKVQDAFKPFTDILKLDKDKVDFLLGDIKFDFGAIIASVSTENDIPYIKTIIENKSLNVYQNVAAINVLVTLYVEGVYKREDLFEYLGFLLDYFADDCGYLTNVVNTCYDVFAKEHFDKIFEYFEKDLIDEFIIGRDFFEEGIKRNDEEKSLEKLKNDSDRRFITDTIKCLQYWACFKEKESSNFYTTNKPKSNKKAKKKDKSKKTKSWKK
ncbi:MAG: DUF1186 family protein [Oscillospiraceae bacterium]|nr:DUF1186 family protein [Oscillospiraceae bacterium]